MAAQQRQREMVRHVLQVLQEKHRHSQEVVSELEARNCQLKGIVRELSSGRAALSGSARTTMPLNCGLKEIVRELSAGSARATMPVSPADCASEPAVRGAAGATAPAEAESGV
mmetsp:Transcript_69537/g.148721  ORF Transcript_69537/g.148721 Transcript_69537/m.148721 type:complete len:113 (-) Transcript_69537:174-512(-)